jgi:hypothetical protein
MDIPWDRIQPLLARRNVDLSDVVSIVEVGSTAHGISVGGDDLDLTIVRGERWSELINGPLDRQSMMIRTQPDGVRSGPGDIDLQVYTLRKFINLAAGGNPSILAALYSTNRWDAPQGLDGSAGWGPVWKDLVFSAKAGDAYIGYMVQQIERWEGKRGQKNVNRPELVAKYGFDTKYAAHAIRLGIQGAEYLITRNLTIPMLPGDQAFIQDIRQGKYTNAQALAQAKLQLSDLRKIHEQMKLAVRLTPDREKLDYNLADWYDQWMERGWRPV